MCDLESWLPKGEPADFDVDKNRLDQTACPVGDGGSKPPAKITGKPEEPPQRPDPDSEGRLAEPEEGTEERQRSGGGEDPDGGNG